MTWYQREITLPPKSRGFHLITRDIEQALPRLREFQVGLAHIFIRHTSASLALNENADPTVRDDMERYFNRVVPENAPYFVHTYEGPDDMPAHLKAVLLGSALTVPISNGRFNLGTWQGIYLNEHRDHARSRTLVITLTGQTEGDPAHVN